MKSEEEQVLELHEAALADWSVGLPELVPESDTRNPAMRLLAFVASLVFFLLGILGWLIPVVTGIPFYVLGLVTLGLAIPAVARRINAWDAKRSPRTRFHLHRMHHRLRRFLRLPSQPPPPLPQRTPPTSQGPAQEPAPMGAEFPRP